MSDFTRYYRSAERTPILSKRHRSNLTPFIFYRPSETLQSRTFFGPAALRHAGLIRSSPTQFHGFPINTAENQVSSCGYKP